MITCTCDSCGNTGTMEKAYGGKGRVYKLPWNWMSMKNGVACGVDCYQILKKKGREQCKLPKTPK